MKIERHKPRPIWRLAVLLVMVWLSLTSPARADWTDDVRRIRELAMKGDYLAAEKAASHSLQRGPGGFLFSGTGTLVIHQWRGRLRLLLGNLQGAIEDGEAIIKDNSSFLPPDVGYDLRAMARALAGDTKGTLEDFEAGLSSAKSGIAKGVRTWGLVADRGISKFFLDDPSGSEADLTQAINADHDTSLMAGFVRTKKEAWAKLRDAIGRFRTGDVQGARELALSARNLLRTAKDTDNSNEFIPLELVVMWLERGGLAVQPAESAPAPEAVKPQTPVDAALLALLETGPKQVSNWGFSLDEANSTKAAVKSVEVNSPAAVAGLRAGDVLISVNGVPIRNARDWDDKQGGFPLYSSMPLAIQRDTQLIEAKIRVPGRLRLRVGPIESRFVIPGVPPPPTGAPSAIEALDAFNVLEKVILDPRTGKIAVVGRYDSRYNSGAIPYLDLLKTALRHPVPRISIDPTPETAKLLQDLKPAITATLSAFPFGQMVEYVQGHPGLERDRQLMIREMARLYGLAPEEYAAWYNFARIDILRQDYKEVIPPGPLRAVIAQAYGKMGYPEVATALPLLYQQTPDAAGQALRALGRSDEASAILARGGGDLYGALMVSAFLNIGERTGSMSADNRSALRKYYNEKKMTWDQVLRACQSVMPYMQKNGRIDFMHQAFARIVLSNPVGITAFPKLREGRSFIRPTDLDRNSQLARILFEADYSLKSLNQYPELFKGIPGFETMAEYKLHNAGTSGDAKSSLIWMEPAMVDMAISPAGNVIDFAASRIKVRTQDATDQINLGAADSDKPDPYLGWITSHLMERYEDYARLLPALHKLREAAKIVALAQWLQAEKVAIDLSDVAQMRWDPPEFFPMLSLISQSTVILPNGRSQTTTYLTTEGGVTFRPKGSWTRMVPSVQSETRALDSLGLSAGLGQKAVLAAQSGDLEQARHLAELSAQAMNGTLSKANLVKLNIQVPEGRVPAVAPVNVQLQKEIIKRTYQHIETLRINPDTRASAALTQLNDIYRGVATDPVSASDYLIKLQTGQLSAASPPSVSPVAVPARPLIATGPCSVILSKAETVPGDRKAYFLNRLAEARNRLRTINQALKKLIALNQAQRAEIEKLMVEITKDYEAATERAYDFAVSILTDLPLAKYADIHTSRIKELENYIKSQNLLLTGPMSEGARKAIELDLRHLTALKDHYQEAFSSTERVLALYSGANYGKDISKWNEDARASGDWKRGLDATLLAGKIFLDHPWLEKTLGRQDWFGDNKLWQVVAMGKMAATASDFFWDVVNQYGAWSPMVANMQKDLKKNIEGMEQLRQKAQKTAQDIQCLERLVQQ